MANVQVEMIEENVETMISNATDSARRVIHAGVGAAAIARENVGKLATDSEKFANDLTEKGSHIAEEQKVAFNEFVETTQTRLNSISNELNAKIEARFNQVTELLLTRLNIPTADSIEDLNKKIASLSRKVDKLSKTK